MARAPVRARLTSPFAPVTLFQTVTTLRTTLKMARQTAAAPSARPSHPREVAVPARIDFLVALLAVQTGLVDAVTFADLCLERSGDDERPLTQTLLERGLLHESDSRALEVLAL